MGQTPLIKIIKPGRFTSVEGTEVSFTLADLKSAAAAYDPASDPAPMVVGHPKLDAPAFGWAERLVVEDGHLCAVPMADKTDPAFAEAVNAGRYPKISGRFYLPDSPGNPKPGHLYLKHIGFLGAAAPAVKGLGMVNLADGEGADLISIETDTQEQAMPEEQKKEVSFADREAELERLAQELKDREAAIANREKLATEQIHASNVSFAQGLVSAGKLAPAGKDLVIGLLDQLEPTETVSFGEGTGEIAPAAALKKLLEGAGTLVSFSEAAKPKDEEQGKGPVSFAAPAGYEVDAKQLELHQKAVELQQANPKLSYIEAVAQAGG